MKFVILFVLVAMSTFSFAWTNEATGEMLQARYQYAACNVDYAEEWLSMREGCGHRNNASVFDSSEHMEDIREDLADLKEAADEDDQFEFGVAMFQYGGHSVRLLGALLGDAFDGHKNMHFFSCVRDDEKPLMDDLEDCKHNAMEQERTASKKYVGNEIRYANDQVDELDRLGANTDGMVEVIGYGDELEADIDRAFDSGETSEIRALYLRHSRILLLFRMQKMLSTIDYARPMIEASSNSNKEEVLEDMDQLEGDIEDSLADCEYSAEVDDLGEYGGQNFECWEDSLDLFDDFNGIRMKILGGIFS
ncbi:MAG: hypothetical protein ABII71_04330 [Candidatus Micrarchaeota archaeon]